MRSILMLGLVASSAFGADWKEFAREDGIIFSSRVPADGTGVKELKANGMFDATPQELWAVLHDYKNWSKTMPYTEESTVLTSDDAAKTAVLHGVVRMPLVSVRDYVVDLRDVSEWKDGAGFLSFSFTESKTTTLEVKDGIVRVPVNDGAWKLEAREGGKKTFVTYLHHTTPGGSVPDWIANTANEGAFKAVVKSVFKAVVDNRSKAVAK